MQKKSRQKKLVLAMIIERMNMREVYMTYTSLSPIMNCGYMIGKH